MNKLAGALFFASLMLWAAVFGTALKHSPTGELTSEETQIVAAPAAVVPGPAAQPVSEKAPAVAVTVSTTEEMKTITLGARNTLSLRGPVTGESAAKLQSDLLEMSQNLSDKDTIYLVLDTPGGSIDAGNQLIDTAKALPQKVKTITVFAASMGFHIAENLDERLIIPSGTLMSHRAKISGLDGEIPGELIVRINFMLKMLNSMESNAATRMKTTLPAYQELIRDEYWVYGRDAVAAKVADRVVLVRCGKDLMGTVKEKVETIFGAVNVTYSKCPVISAPIAVDMAGTTFTEPTQQAQLQAALDQLFNHKREFVKEYIVTNTYRKFFQ
jgi:Protease subunit of ATP-dependent Clp proteases